jgi:hypothetical protein
MIAHPQVVSNKSIVATASVLSLVIGEFVLVVGEYTFRLFSDHCTNVILVYVAKA